MSTRRPPVCVLAAALLTLLAAGCVKTKGDGTLGAACTTDADCNPGLICPADGLSHVIGYCVAVPKKVAPPPGKRQWASNATASSELISRLVPVDAGAIKGAYAAVAATGPPDAPYCGFIGRTWATAYADEGVQTLELSYKTAVYATGVEIVENQNPGAVVKVELIDEAGTGHTVFEGKDPTLACPDALWVRLATPSSYLTRRVRVHVDTDKNSTGVEYSTQFNLVDAVGLWGEAPAVIDAGAPDGSQPDGSQPDASQPDASQPDAGPDGPGADA